MLWPYDRHCPVYIVTWSPGTQRQNSASSRVLPIPGSPTRPTTWPCPAIAAAKWSSQQRQLPDPPHKGTLVLPAPPHHPRMAPHEPLHRIDRHGRGTALHRQGAAGCDPYLRLHELVGGGTQENRPGRGPLLEPRARCNGAPTTVERRCGSWPRPPTTTRPEFTPIRTARRCTGHLRPQAGMGTQTLPQRQRRHHRPPGMVLLGHRRAEHSQEALARGEQEGSGVEVQHLLGQPHHRLQR